MRKLLSADAMSKLVWSPKIVDLDDPDRVPLSSNREKLTAHLIDKNFLNDIFGMSQMAEICLELQLEALSDFFFTEGMFKQFPINFTVFSN